MKHHPSGIPKLYRVSILVSIKYIIKPKYKARYKKAQMLKI